MIRISLQFFGGRGGVSGMTPPISSGGGGNNSFEANFTVSDFNQVSESRWESKRQAVTAAALSGDPNNRTLVGEKSSQFEIVKNGDTYTSYIRGANRRTRIKASKSLNAAVSSINTYTRKYVVY